LLVSTNITVYYRLPNDSYRRETDRIMVIVHTLITDSVFCLIVGSANF